MKITLGEVGTYINGYAFKPSDWGTSGLPIIRIQNLTNQNTIPNYFDGPYNSKFEVNKGDILIAWSGSLGIHVWQKNKALLNQHIFRVEFNKCEIDKMYFYYAVKHNIHKMLHLTHGATMRHIIKSDFEQIIIPYPSLDDQAKISKILNYLEQNIINYRIILSKLDLLIKSRFVEMFGDPNMVALNKSVKLSSVAKIITGNTPSRRLPEYYGDYIEWIKSDNIISTNLYISQAKEFLSEQGAAKGRVAPKDSLLMTCIAGSIRSIGNVGICDRSVAFNQQINAIVLKNNINPLYAYWLLKLFKPSIIANVEMSLKGIISKSQLENMLIPIIASQEEQELFIKFALQINKLKSDVQKSIDETQLLMDSLMQEYFG